MYKVVLVDDEIWSLEGIKKLVEWEKLGFTVAAQATDAEEALELIDSIRPDVVITDIRMPEISGLELLHRCRTQGIQSEIVIISGFAEFEYAQEALRHGAYDYQLKPIDPGDAVALLQKLKHHLDGQQVKRDAELYQQLIQGSKEPAELLRTASFQSDGEIWQAVALQGIAASQFDRQLDVSFADIQHLKLKVRQDKTVLVCNGAYALEQKIRSAVGSCSELQDVYIGLSSMSNQIEQVPKLLKEADMAAVHFFIEESPGLVRFTATSSFKIEGIALKMEKWMMLRDYTEICRMLDTIPDMFRKEQLGIYHVICLWNQFAVIIGKRRESGSGAGIEFLDYTEIVSRFHNLAGLCGYVSELFKEICLSTVKGSVRSNAVNENIISLLEYVNENFNKELSLSELSEKYFLNMSYCSELFKKVSGYTFSDYVTKLRMEAAAELIRTGQYTGDRVCEMTGYKDYYYFSKIFKKFHGLSPSHFTGKTSLSACLNNRLYSTGKAAIT